MNVCVCGTCAGGLVVRVLVCLLITTYVWVCYAFILVLPKEFFVFCFPNERICGGGGEARSGPLLRQMQLCVVFSSLSPLRIPENGGL